MDVPGVAVIGAGYWGRNLVRNFYELQALRVVCDKNEAVLADMAAAFPGTERVFAVSDILSRDDVAAVVVATPAETHYTVVREVLLAGKHVFVEKPLVLREEEALDLIDLAEEGGRILMVGHLLQYHPAFIRLKELVRSGDLGRVNYIYSNRLNLGKIRREENALWSFAPHDISMILGLAGEEVESVSATGGNYLHQKIADVTMTHLHFPSGLRAHIFVSWLHPFKEQKLIVVGDRKMAVFDDTRPWPEKLLLYPHEIRWRNQVPIASKAEPERVPVVEEEPLKRECLQFLASVGTGAPPVTDGKEGLRVLRILNASQQSLDRGGREISFRRGGGRLPAEGFIHPSAVVEEGAVVGNRTRIWHFSHVLPGSRIGENCNIGQNVVIGPDVTIGQGCKIQNNVSVYKGVTLEDGVFCGPSMVFTNVINPRAGISRMDEMKTTLVKKGATLGANATIVCGVSIGRYAFVGAGAVVTGNVPDYGLVVGNPARRKGWVCRCGTTLDERLGCPACGQNYRKGTSGLEPADEK
jgi:UDP-2-acetamido-3-amino-2,3-dideoxy-glucuronate N-acetyltransferase